MSGQSAENDAPPGCYCDRSDHDRCPGGTLCCCSPELAQELAAKDRLYVIPPAKTDGAR